ncbi:Type II secretion system (T2SS), protein F [Candidatus Tiddalikarchaeum anstoanum]|nr:Type II secretion system (T2SS), protein F [Candidatus Tiddalikarchaeum anstoanum]
MAAKFKIEDWVLLISIIVVVLSAFVVYITFPTDLVTWGYFAVYAMLMLIMPYTMYKYVEQSRLHSMEEQFPTLLKDLADNLRAGLTMSQAVKTAANSEYKSLTPEVKRMSNQMSWGSTFEEVVDDLRAKFSSSPFISRGLAILLQAYKSGGDISPIMSSVADSTVLLQNVEKDRESTLSEQAAIIYVIHIVFIIILVILFKVLIPLTTSGSFGAAISGVASVTRPNMDYYRLLFFATIMIESACNGLLTGVTKNGSLLSGVRHFAIMFAFGLVFYVALVLPKALTATAVSEKYNVIPAQQFSISGKVMLDDTNVVNTVVTLTIANTTYTGLTDSNGEYKITILAPGIRGDTSGAVIVDYDNQEIETPFKFRVV